MLPRNTMFDPANGGSAHSVRSSDDTVWSGIHPNCADVVICECCERVSLPSIVNTVTHHVCGVLCWGRPVKVLRVATRSVVAWSVRGDHPADDAYPPIEFKCDPMCLPCSGSQGE